jgi:hypothetical protein
VGVYYIVKIYFSGKRWIESGAKGTKKNKGVLQKKVEKKEKENKKNNRKKNEKKR